MSTAPAPDFGPEFWSRLPNWPECVSRETVSSPDASAVPATNVGVVSARLQIYLDLLRKWQAKINLVSPDSLPDAPTRHILDSVQILPLLASADKTLVDIGSGAGFPGLALALCRDDLAVHLIESDAKKGEFMKTVSRETATAFPGFVPPIVHTARIEKATPFPADVMTARALAPLAKLLDYALPFVKMNPAIRLIFLKGEAVSRETEDALKSYRFKLAEYPSITEGKARILVLSDIERI